MIARATRARVHTLGLSWAEAERIVLTAALEHVPEPADMERAYELSARGLGKRIAELEAKLAAVRVALVEHSPSKALCVLDGGYD